MKKIITLCLFTVLTLVAFAQEKPDRMFIFETSGQTKGYLTERIDSITFAKLEGRVAADVEVLEVQEDKIILSVTRTENCTAFKLVCVTKLVADRLGNDASIAAYVDNITSDLYYEDFTRGELTGIKFADDSEYAIITVGVDKYGIMCSADRADFRTPKKPLVGNPKVIATVTDVKARDFTVSFEPNEDVNGYAAVAGEKGTMQQQYEQFGPMMGFNNFGDLVKSWGVNYTADESFTWNGMDPNTEYEVFIQAWDENGTYADVDIVLVTTKKSGGPGAASVTITLGEYKMTDWDGEQKPSQFITFTPNDQSSCYRMGVYKASDYDQDPEGYVGSIKMDPPMPISNWFQYEELTTDYQIDPNMEVVAIAAAKNSEGVWGEATITRFTTPETAANAPYKAGTKNKNIQERKINKQSSNVEIGKAPKLPISTGIKLINK